MVSAAVTTKIDEIKASIAAESQQVKDAIAALREQITKLEEQITAGADESELLASLDGLKASVDSIYTDEAPVTEEPVV